ncbi:hypothetical protein INS49_015499 [Diaporthe citri]|uniref:uncharacterized protein n=1 Tax=Diaporthe citri TaxID=83186 RepID=UPI001C7E9EB3|nr:uncharacterized protein INS49_015499 [Diaporthe citri]KAG6356114.1 hypothetical protein INS49_015499 [Diaporthe citri]
MSNSSFLPQKHMDPLDEDPDKDGEDSVAAKKSSSAATHIDSTLRTFPRFSDLPAHLRAKVWRMAWLPRRVIPFGSKPAPKFNICNKPQRCECCASVNFRPQTSAPAIMYACREARSETQKISRPLSTWFWELWLPRNLSRAWSKAQYQEFWEEVCYRDEMLRMITWFNPTTDQVFIGPESVLRMSEQVGPPNHDDVLQAALDPALVLMLSAGLFEEHEKLEAEFEVLRSGLRALYDRYLKPRDHIYICEAGLNFLLTDEGLQKAIQEGLFSGEDEEQRLVSASDEVLIKKYEALKLFNHKHTNINASQTLRTWRDTLNTWHTRRSQARHVRLRAEGRAGSTSSRKSASIRVPISDSQMLMIKIADFLMWDQGLGFFRGLEIMDLTGHLKKDHPLVREHGFKLPDFAQGKFAKHDAIHASKEILFDESLVKISLKLRVNREDILGDLGVVPQTCSEKSTQARD